jgi:hypothetical protein
MQIIDELEVNKRGPYGGGLGHVSFSGTMDMALGLRTMVIPTANEDSLYSYSGTDSRREWTVHLQVRVGQGLWVYVRLNCVLSAVQAAMQLVCNTAAQTAQLFRH